MADFGKKFAADDLAELLGLPSSDDLIDRNEAYIQEAYSAGYDVGLDYEDGDEETAEEYAAEAEEEAVNELFLRWLGAVESVAEELLSRHDLELVELKEHGTYKLKARRSWPFSAYYLMDTLNNVEQTWGYATTDEMFAAGPYTPKVAVIAHLDYVKRHPEAFGGKSALELYEEAIA